MSYEKKYLPLDSDIKEEWDEREDRVESEFVNINSMFLKIVETTPTGAGWENQKTVAVPLHFKGKFEVVDAKVENSNGVWLDANNYVRPLGNRNSFVIEVPTGFTNFKIHIIIMKI